MMTRYKYGGLSRPGLYIDETVMRMCYTHRRLFGQLALHLIAEGKADKASKVLQKAAKEIPAYNVPMNYMSGGTDIAKAYALLGQKKEALKCINAIWNDAAQYERYYQSLTGIRFIQAQHDCLVQMSILDQVRTITGLVDRKLAARQKAQLDNFYRTYIGMGGQIEQQ